MQYNQSIIKKYGHEVIERVNNREPLENIEMDIVDNLLRSPNIYMIISGFNRSHRQSRNIIETVSHKGEYAIVVNLLDGNVNYSRNNKIYGISISITNIKDFSQYSIIYDGLNSKIYELASNKCIGLVRKDTLRTPHQNSRLVVGLGRLFNLSNNSLREIKNTSIRSLGSTTISILEVLRMNMDIYINITKLWNIWWALGLCKTSDIFLEDLYTSKLILDNYNEYLLTPEKTILIASYRDPKVKEQLHYVLDDINNAN